MPQVLTRSLSNRRFVYALSPILCLLSLLAGCAKKEAVIAPKKTVMVWHWMTDRGNAFQELAKRYEAKTGVRVNFELYAPSDAYTQKVRAAAQGGNLPDIFGILAEMRDFSAFIKAGYVSDLTAAMKENNQAWQMKFAPEALAVNEFSEGNSYGIAPGIYGVPIDITTIMMLYNKDIFKELGLNPNRPPSTWEEFIAIGKKIKEAKKQGLVSGFGEVWMIDCLANDFAFNIMGKDKVLATIRGEVPYTDPDWVKVFSLFKEMQDSGLLYNGLVSMVNKTAEQLFANGKAAFAFNGSWGVNVYQGMNPALSYAAMLPPRVSDKFPVSVWGGAGSSFMVHEKSKEKEEAVKFLQWLTDKEQQIYLSEETRNLPANKEAITRISPILAQFSSAIEYATHPRIWGISEFSQVIEAFDKGVQSIIIGEKTPEQIAAEVQKIKERELAKKKAK
jgi:ABC-type glycerol-3-phosphate transport system substrate-binding protein